MMETKEYKLTDLCDFQGGTQPPKEEWITEPRDGYVRMLQIRDFTQDKAEHAGYVRDTKKLNKCEVDDILIGRYGASVGKILTGLSGAYNVAIIKTIPKVELLSKRYLYYVLTGTDFQNFILNIGARAAQAGFNKNDLSLFKLHIPTSLEDQERIADILEKAKAIIDKREKSNDLLDAFLKMKFLEMFGDPIKNPKHWELSKIGIECNVKGGKRIPKGSSLTSENTGFPYIKAGNIKKGKVTTENLEYLTPELREQLKRYIVNEGDVCITVVGVNIGDIGIVPKKLHLANLTENANKILIKDKKRVNNIFLAFYLMMDFVQSSFSASIRASGVPKLALFRIEVTDLLVPPIDLQKKFSLIYEIVELLKVDFQKSKIYLDNLYSSLCQRSLKGELEIIQKVILEGTIKVQPKITGEVNAIDKINKKLEEFHKSQPHTGAPDEIDNTIRQLEAELKNKGEIPFLDEYVKYRIVKAKFSDPFTFDQLWEEITKFPFETTPKYDDVSCLLFKWLAEENAFIRQQFNESTKQLELILNETAKA